MCFKTNSKGENMNVKEITVDEWEQIKPHVVISSYGNKATFYDSVEAINQSQKVVTLNGSPLRALKGRIKTAIENRTNNIILKLPNGSYAVASKTLLIKSGFNLQAGSSQSMPEGL